MTATRASKGCICVSRSQDAPKNTSASENSAMAQVYEGPEKLTVCVNKLAELAAMVPFDKLDPAPDGTDYNLSDVALKLVDMISYSCDRWEYDRAKLVHSLMALCVPSNEDAVSWMTDPESFFFLSLQL